MEDVLTEIGHRARRTETKVSKIYEALGLDDKHTSSIKVESNDVTSPTWIIMHVPGFDITLSALKRALQHRQMDFTGIHISVRVSNVEIANIIFEGE